MKTLTIILFLLLLATGAGAQNAAISGRVDGWACVTLLDFYGSPVYTRLLPNGGEFRFTELETGPYSLNIIGESFEETINIPTLGCAEIRPLGTLELEASWQCMIGFNCINPSLLAYGVLYSGSRYSYNQIRNHPVR